MPSQISIPEAEYRFDRVLKQEPEQPVAVQGVGAEERPGGRGDHPRAQVHAGVIVTGMDCVGRAVTP